MRKYEVDRVHNSKDDEIYQIAQSVEQKVRTGMLMPDYEMGQKPFHHWGDVILNYAEPQYPFSAIEVRTLGHAHDLGISRYNFFQTTFELTESGYDGEWYTTDITVNHQGLKINKRQDNNGGISSNNYIVKFSFPYNEDLTNIQYYNEENEEWYYILGHPIGRTIYQFDNNKYKTTINITAICFRKHIKFRTNTGYITKEKLRAYTTLVGPTSLDKGIVISRNKKWIYVENEKLNNVCVKHGGMKYTNDGITIWQINDKNTNYNLLYRAYSRPLNGGKKKDKNTGEVEQIFHTRHGSKARSKWIVCNWLNRDFTFDPYQPIRREGTYSLERIFKLLSRRRKRCTTHHGEISPQYDAFTAVYFIKPNVEQNVFELWRFCLMNTDEQRIKPIFVQNMSPEEGYRIYKHLDTHDVMEVEE